MSFLFSYYSNKKILKIKIIFKMLIDKYTLEG